MKNLLSTLILLLAAATQSSAQDVLMFLDGNEEEVKITEVSSSEVKYKRMNNLEGPTFSTLKNELFMIKYANGDKEMITAENAQPAATPQQEYTTENAMPASTTGSGLSSAVIVTDEPTSTSPSNVDKWGRTEAENRSLYKKKIVKGAVVLGVGGAMAIPGVVLFGLATRYDAAGGVTRVADTYRIAGALLTVGGAAMIIAGAAVMGSSAKYKKRANMLANGTASISPVLLNDTHYSGLNVNANPGFGMSFSYNF